MKKTKMKASGFMRFVSLLLITILLLLTFVTNDVLAFATENEQIPENTSLTKLSKTGDYYTDKVIIVLNKEETQKFRTYTPKDFPEIDCISVNDLTAPTVDYARRKIQGEKVEHSMLLNVNNFRRILSLELEEKSEKNVLAAIDKLKKRNDIASAEPNAKMEIFASPNDPKYANNEQWGLSRIGASSAWDVSTGTNTVKVAVMDSGIDATHQDLSNHIFRDTIHNINTTLHRDFTNGTSSGNKILEPTDPFGHGTHVAGIIGAQGNNGIGVTGVAWNVRLISLRVFNSNGEGELAWVTNAVSYAQSIGVSIANFSGGGPSGEDALQNVISSYDGLFVVSAGNKNNNNDNTPSYPANYTSANILSVGASDQNDNRSDWTVNNLWNLWGLLESNSKSNYGATTVDIFAPGTGILSTIPGNKYEAWNGTSMAAPFVTGVAALLLSHNKNLTTAELKAAILNSATPVSALSGLCVTGGRLNSIQALKSIAVFDTRILSNNTIEIRGTFGRQLTGSIEIPAILNGRSVTSITTNAFTNQTNLAQISIPASITSIESNAFLNTNQAKIYFTGRTSVPETFHSSWNPSSNPVYFGTSLCSHSSKSTHEKDNSQHWDFCNNCRTYMNITNHQFYISGDWQYCHDCSYSLQVPHTHNYTHRYEDLGNTHRLYCECGNYQQGGHVGMPDNIGDRYVLCFQCKYLIDTNKYFISLIMRTPINLNDCDCEDDSDHYHDIDSMMISAADIFLNRKAYIVEPENTNA